jgi:hypothetical protein
MYRVLVDIEQKTIVWHYAQHLTKNFYDSKISRIWEDVQRIYI